MGLLSAVAVLLLSSCAPSDPLQHVAELVPDASLVDDLRPMAPDFGLALVVTPDVVRVAPLGSFEGFNEDSRAVLFTDTAWEGWEQGEVAVELREAQRVYRDAALIARADLGLDNPEGFQLTDTLDWLGAWWEDPRMARDVRFMVPFGEDMARRPIAWTVLGVKLVDVTVAYDEPPGVRSLDPGVELDVTLTEARYTLPVLVFSELTVAEVLDRQAFRALADEHPHQRDLMRALAPVKQGSTGGCGG